MSPARGRFVERKVKSNCVQIDGKTYAPFGKSAKSGNYLFLLPYDGIGNEILGVRIDDENSKWQVWREAVVCDGGEKA